MLVKLLCLRQEELNVLLRDTLAIPLSVEEQEERNLPLNLGGASVAT